MPYNSNTGRFEPDVAPQAPGLPDPIQQYLMQYNAAVRGGQGVMNGQYATQSSVPTGGGYTAPDYDPNNYYNNYGNPDNMQQANGVYPSSPNPVYQYDYGSTQPVVPGTPGAISPPAAPGGMNNASDRGGYADMLRNLGITPQVPPIGTTLGKVPAQTVPTAFGPMNVGESLDYGTGSDFLSEEDRRRALINNALRRDSNLNNPLVNPNPNGPRDYYDPILGTYVSGGGAPGGPIPRGVGGAQGFAGGGVAGGTGAAGNAAAGGGSLFGYNGPYGSYARPEALAAQVQKATRDLIAAGLPPAHAAAQAQAHVAAQAKAAAALGGTGTPKGALSKGKIAKGVVGGIEGKPKIPAGYVVHPDDPNRLVKMNPEGHGDYGEGYDSLGHRAIGSRGTGPTSREKTQMFETLKLTGEVFWPGSYSTWWSAGKPLAKDMSDAEKNILSQGGDWNDVQTYRMVNPGAPKPGTPAPTDPNNPNPQYPPGTTGAANPPNWAVPGLGPWSPPMYPQPGQQQPQPLPNGLQPLQDPNFWRGYHPDRMTQDIDQRDAFFKKLPPDRQALVRAHEQAGYPQQGQDQHAPPAGYTQPPTPGRPPMPDYPYGQNISPYPEGYPQGEQQMVNSKYDYPSLNGPRPASLNGPRPEGNFGGGYQMPTQGGGNGLTPNGRPPYNGVNGGDYSLPYFTQPSYSANMTPEQMQNYLAYNSQVAYPWAQYMSNTYQNNRDFDRNSFTNDRDFGRNVYMDDRNYNTDVFRDTRNFGEDTRRYDQGFREDTRRFDNTLDWTKTADAMRTFGSRQMPNVKQMSFR
jgi:hypothetical protein